MALKYSEAVRNAQLDAFEATIGTAPILEIRSGAAPANCAAADSGTLLASMALPNDWMAAAASGSKAKSGTWEDISANATGTAGHFRIKNTAGSVCHAQGTISQTGDSPVGDMVLDNKALVAGQSVTISTFTLTAGNA